MPRSQRRTLFLILAGILLAAGGLWIGSGINAPAADRGSGQDPKMMVSGQSVSLAEEGEIEEPGSQPARQALAAPGGELAGTASLRIELRYANGDPGEDLLVVVRPEDLARDAPSKQQIVKRSDSEGVVECRGLAPGSYTVGALHPVHFEQGILLTAGKQTLCAIQFDVGMLLTGEVLDRQDRSVAGASIWSGGSIGIEPIATSDAGGRFRLPSAQQHFRIGATASGYAPSPMRTIPWRPGGEGHVQLVLQGSGGSVQGRVLSSQGEPVQGALVIFPNTKLPWTFLKDEQNKRVTEVRVVTDARGTFFAKGLPPIELSMVVRAEGHGAVAETVQVYASGTTEITLHMTETGIVHGRVLNQEDEGLEGMLVTAYSNQWGIMAKARSEAEGRYVLADLSLGEIQVQAYDGEERSQWQELTLAAGEVREQDFIFTTGAELRGRVVDHQDKALVGWLISAVPYRTSGSVAFAETEADGGFLLEHLEQESLYTLQFMAPVDGWPPNHTLHGVRSGTQDLLIRLPAEAILRGSIRGRVLDANGKPFESPRIAMLHLTSENPMIAEIDAQGAFHSGSLPTGRYLVSITLGPQRRHLLIPMLGPGEDLDLGLIQTDPLGTLSVNFVSPAGQRPESVTFLDKNHRWIGAIDLVDGELEDYPMIPGSHLMQVFGARLSSGTVPIQIHSGEHSEIEVTLDAGIPCEFSFTFADSQAVPVRLLDLRIFDAAGRALMAEQLGNRDGSFTIRRPLPLPPGLYSLEASCSTGVSAKEEFEVPARANGPLAFSYRLR